MEQQELIQLQEQVRLKKQIELIEENAKKFLSKEALNRFGNLKLAFPDKSLRVCGLILEAVNQGHIKEQLSDKEFLNLLRMIEEPKKEFRLKK